MMPEQHALLSASGAHRWLACPPSARLEADLPDSSSPAALQGTVAHALAEWKLRRALHQAPTMRPVSEWIDSEMEALTDDYTSFVLEHLSLARQSCGDARVLIEQRLDFSHIVSGGFGTGDAVIIAQPRLEIIDLKYGQGVLVDAENNPQLMLYGLGALHTYGALYDIDEVVLTIYQPRRANVTTWTIPVVELLRWGEQVVKPIAEAAAEGKGVFKAGEHCRFCKLAPTCRARSEKSLELAKYEFAPPAQLSDAEIAEVLAQLPTLRSWASDVEAYALSQAVNQGKQWAGFKVVEGRSIRKYKDETKAAQTLEDAGVVDIWQRKLKTITALEKQLGRKRFTDMLGDLVVKPAGKPTLVPESDKRPALQTRSAVTEFKENTENNHERKDKNV